MDDKQFAAITRPMGREITRRGALGRLVAGLVAAAGMSRLASSGAEAQGSPQTTCTGLGFKIEPVVSGTYPIDAFGNSITITVRDTPEGTVFDFESNFGIDAILVKGGPVAIGPNVYTFDPEATSGTGLHSPLNPNSGKWYGLSHLDICFDYELTVTKTAVATFDRDWDWTIDKSSTVTELELAEGQLFEVPYKVDVTASSTDTNFEVSGTIEICNNTPFSAKITAIVDTIKYDDDYDNDGNDDEVPADVNCPDLPANGVLTSGQCIECTYSSDAPEGAAAGDTGTNQVRVRTENGDDFPVGGDSDSANFTFELDEEIDECVDISDSLYGPLGAVCAENAPETFNYSYEIPSEDVPLTCGETLVTNVASLTNDDGQTETDSWTVTVTIDCENGCTLTQGYWKTHAYGRKADWPEGFDPGANFYLSGKTWHDVLTTSPAGNPYYTLAHQFIAATLNVANGASVPEAVQTALDDAAALFEQYKPAEVAAKKTSAEKARQEQFKSLVGILDDYNNGDIGPGHCDELPEDEVVSAQRAGGGGKADDKGGKAKGGKQRGKGRGKSKGRGKGKN